MNFLFRNLISLHYLIDPYRQTFGLVILCVFYARTECLFLRKLPGCYILLFDLYDQQFINVSLHRNFVNVYVLYT